MPQPAGTGPTAGSESAGQAADATAGRERPSLIDAFADLVQLFVDFLRQEAGDLVTDKIVQPTQKAGQVVAFALAAAFALILGLSFISAGLLILLARFVGWVAALLIVGAAFSLVAGALTAMKMRRVQ